MALDSGDPSNTSPDSDEGCAGGERARVDSFHLKPGTALRRYTVLNELGRGAQGVVYAAFDPALDRRVALKLLRGNADLLREARELASLTHPNIVVVHDVDTFAGDIFIAMQFMAGGTLKAFAEKKPPVAELVQRFVEAGRGLAAVHASGRVHRDFKPENVLLDERGVAHVSDFGLARAQQTASGHVGTTKFMAPEVLAAGTASPAADQYAFCVSLYWALTGHFPDPALRFEQVPPALRPVLARGLSACPADRFPSVDVMLEALARDPAATRRRVLRTVAMVCAIALAATAIGLFVLVETPAQRALRECSQDVARLESELWTPARVDEMQRAFIAAAGPFGSQSFERVRSRMQPEVESWARESRAACALPDSSQRMTLQGCLQARAQTLKTMTELFRTADRDTVDSAVLTVGLEVRAAESCHSSGATRPLLQDTIADQSLRPRLAPARVLHAAGKLEDARSLALEIAALAEETNASRVLAEAELLAGQLSAELHESSAAPRLHKAITLAEAVGADEPRARAWLALASFHAARQEFPAAREARQQAVAIVQRLGFPELLEAQLRNTEGNLQMALGDVEAANQAYLRQYELLRRHRPEDDPLVNHALNNVLLSGDRDKRIAGFVTLLHDATLALGDAHPETLFTRHNLAAAYLDVGRCEEALGHARAVRELRLLAGPQHEPFLPAEYLLEARSLSCLHRTDEAIAAQEEGVRRLRDLRAPDHQQRDELNYLLALLKTSLRPVGEVSAQQRILDELGP